jgi:peroxiredoxin
MNSFIKKIITGFALVASVNTFAGDPQGGSSIKVTSKGLKEGSMCLLACYYGDKNYIKDSAKANAKGEVVFEAKEKYPQGIYLFVPPSKKYFDFVMDEPQHFSLETDSTDYIKTMKVKGSDENKYFFEYQNFIGGKQKEIEPYRAQLKKIKDNKDSIKVLQDKMEEIDKQVIDYKLNFIKNNPKTFVAKLFKAMEEITIPEAPILANGVKDSTFAYRYYKSHFFDNIDFTDDRLLRTPIFHNKVKQYMEKLTPQTPDSINISADYLVEKARPNSEMFKYMVYWLTNNYETSPIMGMDAVFVHMVEKYYVTKQVYWADSTQLYKIANRAYILKQVLIGKKAPPIVMKDTLGHDVSLYDVKANYTVVVFWEPTCGHCKKEIPKLAELYEKIKGKGVKVFAIDSEDEPVEWKKFIIEHKLDWINVSQPDAYKRAVTKKIYDIYSTPTIYLLDENKIIKAKRVDTEQIGNFIEYLEKEKTKK